VPAHQAFASGELADELHGGRAVVDDDQVVGAGDGQQQLYVSGEGVSHDDPVGPAQLAGQAADGAEGGRGAAAGLLPADLVAVVAGQFGHAAQLAAGHRVGRGQDDEGEPRAGLLPGTGSLGVGPLQDVQELYRALDEREGVGGGAGCPGARAHLRTTVP
jgi:hypothetical protein